MKRKPNARRRPRPIEVQVIAVAALTVKPAGMAVMEVAMVVITIDDTITTTQSNATLELASVVPSPSSLLPSPRQTRILTSHSRAKTRSRTTILNARFPTRKIKLLQAIVPYTTFLRRDRIKKVRKHTKPCRR